MSKDKGNFHPKIKKVKHLIPKLNCIIASWFWNREKLDNVEQLEIDKHLAFPAIIFQDIKIILFNPLLLWLNFALEIILYIPILLRAFLASSLNNPFLLSSND